LFSLGDYTLKKDDKTDTIIGCYYLNTRKIIGIFPVKSEYCDIYINSVKDGSYINQIDNNVITVNYGVISTNGKAVIFKTTE
ncbi:MAG: hypothetical protein LBQ68_03870, partial [Clostridiales bacterium]|jgi:hypothetical protein|nr:hypothetical protein [Clostridiales bacterium]